MFLSSPRSRAAFTLVANALHVGARFNRRQQRQRGTIGPRVLERVVHVVEVRGNGGTAERAYEPQVLIVPDVREIPRER